MSMSSSRFTRFVTVALACSVAAACSDQGPLSPDEATTAELGTLAAAKGSQPPITGVALGGLMSSRKILEDYVYAGFAQPGMGIEHAIPVDGSGPSVGYVDIHGALHVEVDLHSFANGLIPYTAVVDATLYYPAWESGAPFPQLSSHRMELTLTRFIGINSVPDDIKSAAEFREWLVSDLYPMFGQGWFFYFSSMRYRIGEGGLPVQVLP
jgi:hypothetical protein